MGASVRPEMGIEQEDKLPDADLWERKVDEGWTEEQATRYVEGRRQRLGGKVPQEDQLSKPANLLRMAAQGATFGFADEGAALLDKLTGRRSYSESVEANRAQDDAFRRDNRKSALAAEIAGGIATPVGVLGMLGKGARPAATLGGQMVRGAKAGAAAGSVTGALAGTGYGEGTLKDRLPGALFGAAAGTIGGAVVGGGLPAAGRGASALLDALRAGSGKPVTSAMSQAAGPRTGAVDFAGSAPTERQTTRAADKLHEAFERDQVTTDDFAAQIRERLQNPKPETALEYGGENVVGLAETVASLPGRGRQVLSEMQRGRVGEPFSRNQPMRQRIRSDIETSFGMPAGSTTEAAESITKNMQTKARPMFERAFSGTSVPAEAVAPLLSRPSVQRAVRYAKEVAAEAGEAFPDLAEGEAIPLKALHHVKLALDDMLYLAKREMPSSVTESSTGPTKLREIAKTRYAIREILRKNDDYRQASDLWAGESALRDALEEGAGAASNTKLTAADLTEMVREMSPSEQQMFRQGYINSLVDLPDNAGFGHNPARRIVNTPAAIEKLDAAFGNTGATDDLLSGLSREDAMFAQGQRVFGNSATARRLAGQADIQDLPPLPAGQPTLFGTVTAPVRAGYDAVRRRQTEYTAEGLAELMAKGGKDPFDINFVAEAMRQAAERAAARQKRVGGTARVAGAATGTATGRAR